MPSKEQSLHGPIRMWCVYTLTTESRSMERVYVIQKLLLPSCCIYLGSVVGYVPGAPGSQVRSHAWGFGAVLSHTCNGSTLQMEESILFITLYVPAALFKSHETPRTAGHEQLQRCAQLNNDPSSLYGQT